MSLRHALSVTVGVQKSLREQNVMFFKRNLEIVGEFAIPGHFHVVPLRVGRSSRGISGGPLASAVDRRSGRPLGPAHEVDI